MIEQSIKKYENKCDYIDARVHELIKEDILLENGETSNIYSSNKTIGVRVLINGGWGLAYTYKTNNIDETINKAIRIAKLSATNKKEFNKQPAPISDDKKYYYNTDPFSINPTDKIKLLKEYESKLKKEQSIKNTKILIECSRVNKTIITPNAHIKQEFTNNILRVFVTAREGDLIQSTSHHYSQLGGYENITSLNKDEITKELTERINRLLHAKAPKAERATVVCDPLMTGLFFHEAVGHACEADAILNNASQFKGMKGQLIASEEVNLLDDPTIKERGFYWYDDEGVKARPTPLITNGVLTGFMHSLRTANEMGEEPTGNGRVMNANYNPIPRMSNTVLKAGEWSYDELIKKAGNGYLVKGFKGGVVDPITGQFSFGASECYRIVNGEVTEPLRDVTLAGNILQTLKGINVGNDPLRTKITGTCGKQGQSVRVGDYCPSILIKEAIIGGSA